MDPAYRHITTVHVLTYYAEHTEAHNGELPLQDPCRLCGAKSARRGAGRSRLKSGVLSVNRLAASGRKNRGGGTLTGKSNLRHPDSRTSGESCLINYSWLVR